MKLGCKILIWGAGGHGRVVAAVARDAGVVVVGFIDRDANRIRSMPSEPRVVCLESDLESIIARGADLPCGAEFVALGIGDNRARLSCAELLNERCASALVHPSAIVDSEAKLSRGVVIMAGAIVGCEARVEEAAIINTGAVIDHDCHIGRGAHVSPGAVLTGSVTIEERAWVGAGATIIPGLCIGTDAIVGAGAVVLSDVSPGMTVVGSPARPIHH